VTHGEKMARAALKLWLDLYSKQVKCEECIPPKDAVCHKHDAEVARLIQSTRRLLATGPN